jgi:hypothetical protein
MEDKVKMCDVCKQKEARLVMGDEHSFVASYYCGFGCLGKRTAVVKNVKRIKGK